MKNKIKTFLFVFVFTTISFFVVKTNIPNHLYQKQNYIAYKIKANQSLNNSNNLIFSKKNESDLYSKSSILSNSLNWDENLGSNLISNLVNFLINKLKIERKIFEKIKQENYKVSHPKFIDLLKQYNDSDAIEKPILLRTSDWSKIDFKKLNFLSYFKNITSIVFKVDKTIISNNLGTPFSVDSLPDLNWLYEMPNLSSLEFNFAVPSKSKLEYAFEDFNFLSKLTKLKLLNISTLISKDSNFKIMGNIFLTKWFAKAKKGFKVYVPSDRLYLGDQDVKIRKSNNGHFFQIEKIASGTIEEPSYENNKPIYIDNEKIEAFLVNGKWYWALPDPKILLKVTYGNKQARRYFTNKPSDEENADLIQKIKKISQLNKRQILEKLVEVPKLFKNLDKRFINSANDRNVIIDNKIYKYTKVIGSKIYLNFNKNLSLIKYAYFDKKNDQIKYFTSNNKMNTIELASGTSVIKNNLTKFPNISIDISNPSSENDFLLYNDRGNKIKIITKLIKGKFYWDFTNVLDAKDFKFYSKSKKILAKKLSDFSILKNLPSDINSIYFNDKSPSLVSPIIDGIKIKDAKNFNDLINNPPNILIDDKKYSLAIRDGKWFYDGPIELIKYEYNNQNITKYYSSLKYIHSKKLDLNKVSQLSMLQKHIIPSKRILSSPMRILNDRIFKQIKRIDGKIYKVALRNGELYWDIDTKFLLNNKIYSDIYGNLYSKINNFLPIQITEVDISSIIKKKIPKKYELPFLENIKLNSQQIWDIIKKGISINDKEYNIFLFESKIYLQNFNSINKDNEVFAVNFRDKYKYNLYSKKYLEKITIAIIQDLWELKDKYILDFLDVEKKLPIITDPKNSNEKPLQIMLSDGLIKEINVETKKIGDKNKLFWSDPEKVQKLKYKIQDGSKIYYSYELNSKILNKNNLNVSNLGKNRISFFDEQNLKKHKIIKTENNSSKKISIIIISSVGSIIVLAILVIAIIRLKRGG